MSNFKPYIYICIVTIISTLFVWLPFLLQLETFGGYNIETPGFLTVLKNWDGPLYIIPAKTWYNTDHPLFIQNLVSLPKEYFAAHLPGYPLSLYLFSPFVGFLKATVFSTLFFSILLFCFFYYFVKKYNLTKQPLFLTFVFMFITPRFLAVRATGSPESMFMLFTMMSIYYFMEKRFWLAGFLGGLATITKTPGILLFGGYGLYIFSEHILSPWSPEQSRRTIGSLSSKIRDAISHFARSSMTYHPLLLIPLSLLAVFTLYYLQYGDFFIYFKAQQNNGLKLTDFPFSVFNGDRIWIGTAWLEEILYLYFFYLIAILNLFKNEKLKPIFYYMITFFIAIICLAHRDVSRYSLPILPFALIACENFFTSKYSKIALIILIPAIYMYTINFINFNTAPIADWTPFL